MLVRVLNASGFSARVVAALGCAGSRSLHAAMPQMAQFPLAVGIPETDVGQVGQ